MSLETGFQQHNMPGKLPRHFVYGLLLMVFRVAHAQTATPVIDAVHKATQSVMNRTELPRSKLRCLSARYKECRAQIVKSLLDRVADPNLGGKKGGAEFMESGQTALTVASGCFIARRRAQLAPERGMPADYVAYELAAPARMAHDLIDRGAHTHTRDSNGQTPLMYAAMQSWSDVIIELLAAHAAVNARARHSLTIRLHPAWNAG